ncbi:MAG: DUF599 family protein [Hyphomicrobiaceae bacterium]|nr:DUF599 family protein [Hyphomicrobiaceae bacterium]
MIPPLSTLDWIATLWFVIAWLGFGWVVNTGRFGPTLTSSMEQHRRQWMRTMVGRDLRIIDTSIMSGLQNGTAFFASTALLALGGSFTLLAQTDRMLAVFQDLPLHLPTTIAEIEIKIVGLIVIYAYAFFKFGWAYRLFNYASILVGGVAMTGQHPEAREEALVSAARAAEMQILASRHFNRGLRAFFFSLGFLGWFLGAVPFLISTGLILLILLRRQYGVEARIAAGPPGTLVD